ncbi:MAG: zinc ABC transporter substrate-binding protein [Turicibacter sp.]|nr:zinc ABC transporter substrate-binding protein [Turicibacter sp.]
MKKLHLYLSGFVAAGMLLAGCGQTDAAQGPAGIETAEEGKLQVIATLFPQYDFARQIGGDKVEVTKMLAPGVSPHTYEPTPQDIIALNAADLFIYTGSEMEPWVSNIIGSIDADLTILDVSQNVALIPWGGSDGHDHGDDGHNHDLDEDGHGHEDDHDHDAVVEDDHDHGHEEEDGHAHSHNYDPHIWTSPVNAIVMANNVLDSLIALSPGDEAYFRENAETLIFDLEALDADFRELVANSERQLIIHGGNFAAGYLMAEYGIEYMASPNETEPSAALVSQMMDEIKEQQIPVIFFEELAQPQIANMIAADTGAKALLLHTAHNLSNDDFHSGVTYVEIMRQNLENLRIALN